MLFRAAKPSAEDSIAAEIAQAFAEGKVCADLQGHGISTLSAQWRGRRVSVSWYSSGRHRDLTIDGDAFFPKGRGSELIFKSAMTRADMLLSEKLAALAEKKE